MGSRGAPDLYRGRFGSERVELELAGKLGPEEVALDLQRHGIPPHRLHSPLDRGRLRAEREELPPERGSILPRCARGPAGGVYQGHLAVRGVFRTKEPWALSQPLVCEGRSVFGEGCSLRFPGGRWGALSQSTEMQGRDET